MIACLRRVDRGDPVDSVIRDYPEEANWLREHLAVSGALQMADRPSAEKKSRARESLLYAVAQSAPPASVATRVKFGFALAPAVLMIAICVGLTAGVAAASGVNLRSVAEDVVDSLVEPLPLWAPPLSAEGPQDAIGLDSPAPAAGDDAAGDERPTREPGDAVIDADGVTASETAADGASDDTSMPAGVDPFNQTNRPEDNPNNPTADDPQHGASPGGAHGAQPGEAGPPATPGPGGPPDGHGHDGPDGPGDHGDNGQPGGNASNGNGSDGGHSGGSNGNPSNGSNNEPDGSTENPPNGADGSNVNPPNGTDGGPHGSNGGSDQGGGASTGSKPGDKGGKGGSR